MAHAYIGTSGWNYSQWAGGEFYPKALKSSEWLGYFAQHFETVEINNTFYRLPSEATFQDWRTQVPPGFVFAIKASRFLTHLKRLKDPEQPLDLFFSRARHLKDRFGPVLFQLPPRFNVNLDRLSIFLRALKKHIRRNHRRHVIEFRDQTWLVPPVFDLLRVYGVALCFTDWRDMPVSEPVTADFIYVRRHYGGGQGGNYLKEDLDEDVKSIRNWLNSGLDVYLYFNNDFGGHAVRNASYVKRALQASFTGGSGKPKPVAN